MDYSASALTALQRAVLAALRDGPPFYLSGGAALAAAYLGHRQSLDLDFFVASATDVSALARHLESAAAAAHWQLRVVQQYPGFRRYAIRAGGESTLVDIVHEPAAQLVPIGDALVTRLLQGSWPE